MVIEGIELHFDEDEGHLRLDCRDEEFTHLRDVVLAESSAADQLSPFIEGIRSIAVRRLMDLRDTVPRRVGLGCRILLISLALSISLAIQVIGIFAIAWWLWTLGS
jgi:hypothetical protein